MRAIRLAAAAAVLACLGACATLHSSKAPDTDLKKLKTFYVANLPADRRSIEKMIAARLTTMGFQSTSGLEQTPPAPVDAVVTYQDHWMWDITNYMIRLNVQIRDGRSGSILATGEAMRPSLQRKSPEGMVEEVVTEIFK
ncbi:MAG: hypothetical protein WDO56_20830 [Gammaproteobacteria bacterium]